MAPWPAAPSGAGGHRAGAAGGAQKGQAQLRSSRAGGRARGGGTKAEVNLDSLNVNELKEILKSRGIVDFGDCFEKCDLIDKIKTLGNDATVDVAIASESTPTDPFSSLSVAQLKEILGSRGVDFSDCCEKSELIHKIKTLAQVSS